MLRARGCVYFVLIDDHHCDDELFTRWLRGYDLWSRARCHRHRVQRPVRLDCLFFFAVACVLQLIAGVACAWQGKGTCPIDCDCDEVVL